ncbi:MAG TPA: S8 family serine peptidase [Gaiellaceae bacterium]|jgi:subtilisin family serine protease|nr:S8 family serine peptidase [Gaiellaceae bacterium]
MKRPLAALGAAALVLTLAGPGAAHTNGGGLRPYVVVFAGVSGVPANASQLVAEAGGTVTATLPQLGAVRASSARPDFAAALATSSQVVAAGPEVARRLLPLADDGGSAAPAEPAAALPGGDPLSGQQWDKARLEATPSGSYAVQRGRRDVVVAVLDTGADTTHPDVAPNLDLGRSRSFVPSEPDVQDHNGHGTWCLSAVAAPLNGVGIEGVAPNVTTLALKVLDRNGDGSFSGIAQALVYAADQHVDVASLSLGAYIDRKPDKADYELLRRALQYARGGGVLPVAAIGNDDLDLSDPTLGKLVELPADLPGVVGVSATGALDQKAYYSNHGTKQVDVAAPGGDRRFQPVPAGVRGGGRVLGAWPAEAVGSVDPSLREQDCRPGGGCATYAWEQGTSMATPNAAGVAALIVSQLGRPHMAPDDVEKILEQTATPLACPNPPTVTYDVPPGILASNTATCEGSAKSNGFYGSGLVDALRAVRAR